ncbi:MAG TPA: TIGR01440 family protein [Bacilli bacterium]
MAQDAHSLADGMEAIVRELAAAANLRSGQCVVFGVSTSEVGGARIGTAGSEEIAAALYAGIERVRAEIGFYALFQCCEHLNRALVVERELLARERWEQVSAVPVPKAGGSMAAYAFRRLREPCLVEAVQADAGIDIGDTLIGMHVRRVAVPFRPSVRTLGGAHVNAAFSRPKLIGGARAVYALEQTGALSAARPDATADHCL